MEGVDDAAKPNGSVASMGPRPNGRGWADSDVGNSAVTNSLQWGRDLTDADGEGL